MSDEKKLALIILALFFVVELAMWVWVMSFDKKAGTIMLIYGFICACRSTVMDRYRALPSPHSETGEPKA
jgi:hypothetical protein